MVNCAWPRRPSSRLANGDRAKAHQDAPDNSSATAMRQRADTWQEGGVRAAISRPRAALHATLESDADTETHSHKDRKQKDTNTDTDAREDASRISRHLHALHARLPFAVASTARSRKSEKHRASDVSARRNKSHYVHRLGHAHHQGLRLRRRQLRRHVQHLAYDCSVLGEAPYGGKEQVTRNLSESCVPTCGVVRCRTEVGPKLYRACRAESCRSTRSTSEQLWRNFPRNTGSSRISPRPPGVTS